MPRCRSLGPRDSCGPDRVPRDPSPRQGEPVRQAARLWARTVEKVKALLPRREAEPARKPGAPLPGTWPARTPEALCGPRPRGPVPSPDSAAPSTELTQLSGFLLSGARGPCAPRERPADPAASLSGGSGTCPAVQPPGVGLGAQRCPQRPERRAERPPPWPRRLPADAAGCALHPLSRRRACILGVAPQRNGELAWV